MDNERTVEDLAFLRGVMEKTHLSTLATGIYFIVWGALIAVGLIYSVLQAAYAWSLSPWVVWLVLVAGGWAVSAAFTLREKRRGRTSSPAGRVLAVVWLACGISVTVALFAGLASGAMTSAAVPGVLACFLAIGMAATGALTGVRWLGFLAVAWWVCAVGLFLVAERTAVLGLAACMLVLFVVPGVVLEIRAPSSGLRGERG